ncbi:MAG TPA: Ldh family oxidoreductase [Alphaproteobacteria bacterium]|nr:Ldh family oxidoreductase [Alphaproteobacteria bacterium]
MADLCGFASALLMRSGLPVDRAAIVTEILVEADLMGHTTHGLQLLAPYLQDLAAGKMTKAGEPEVVADHGGAVTWDGKFLPGPWLVARAIELACARVSEHKVATVVIRRAHHIACLATYLKRATDRGLMILLTCSDPNVATVAPHGALAGRYTPNPFAAGWPTDGEPVLLDISASTTTNGLTGRMYREGKGERLRGKWLVDNRGEASDDPAMLFTEPPGAILPLGGMELGHKGFALGLLVETLTGALGGYGRSSAEKRWTGCVFVQVIDPAGFGGREAFVRETSWMAQACRTAPVRPGNPPVRLPGERGLALRRQQLELGIALYPGIMDTLVPWAEKLGVPLPERRTMP